MKKLLIMSLLLSCAASNIKPMELSESQQKQRAVSADAECFICNEDAKSISDQKGPGFLRKTSCCKQFLCGSCNNELGIRKIKQCPHCRHDGFDTTNASLEVEKRIEPVAQQKNKDFFVPEVQSQEDLEKLIQEQLKIEAEIELRKKQESINKSQDKRLAHLQEDSRVDDRLKVQEIAGEDELMQRLISWSDQNKERNAQIVARRDEQKRSRAEQRSRQAQLAAQQQQAPAAQNPVVNGNQARVIHPVAPINPNVINPNNAQDLLHRAILRNSAEEIRQEVQAGADVNRKKEDKEPILWAVLLKRFNAVEALLVLGAGKNIVHSGHTLTLCAMKLEDIKSAISLVKNGADFLGCDEHNKDVMHHALELLEKNVQVNSILVLIQELLNKQYETKYLSPVFAAANRHWCDRFSSRSISEAQYFISRIRPLFWRYAIRNSEASVNIADLIEKGANPNEVFACGMGSMSPLLIAVELNKTKAITILLEAGANINKKASAIVGRDELTPLAYAVALGKSEMVEFLLEHGANL